MNEVLLLATPAVLVTTGTAVVYKMLHNNKKEIEFSNKAIIDRVTTVELVTSMQGPTGDALLFLKNIQEIKDYYLKHVQQAKVLRNAGIAMAILGFIIFQAGIILTFIKEIDHLISYASINGGIMEIVAITCFVQYSKAMRHGGVFHDRALNMEKFLNAIHLTEKITDNKNDSKNDNKNRVYYNIIEKMIN